MEAREELRQLRSALGYTQTEMANVLRTTLRSYQRWEAGVHRVPELALDRARELQSGRNRATRAKK